MIGIDKLILYVIFLVAIGCHEGAHAYVALWWGDDTGARNGQATLLPFRHMQAEPFGTIVLPLLFLALSGGLIGYARVPVERHRMRDPIKGMLTTALAGPMANLVLALIGFAVIRALLVAGFIAPPALGTSMPIMVRDDLAFLPGLVQVASMLLLLNLLLLVFNLIPAPPLDGATILMEAGEWFGFNARGLLAQAGPILFIVVFLGFYRVFDPIRALVMRLLYSAW